MFHFYSKPSKNRLSFAGVHKEGVLKIAVARCSKKDTFVKKKGRAIAEGRLHKDKIYHSIPLEICDGRDFVKAVEPLVEPLLKDPTLVNKIEKVTTVN